MATASSYGTMQQAAAFGNRIPDDRELALRRHQEQRLLGLRINRYSWWVHGRELADFYLPRRYKWLITPNQMGRGSPINQHILDSTPTIAARNLAAGIMYGISNPTAPWFRLAFGRVNSSQTGPIAVYLRQVEEILFNIFQESNFYQALAILYFDLVIFGTASMIIYEDFRNVINCVNPCFGEFYADVNAQLNLVDVFYREFTYTVQQVVERWGLENVSPSVASLYRNQGSGLTREVVVAHGIEPNYEARKYGIPSHFKYRECYWEWGGSASPQGGSTFAPGFLEQRGFYEAPHITPRWDTVANDAYGRSPAMDALPDCKQLQLQVRRQAQGIDKQVNPPLQADLQLKNQPAALIPGGITYIAGLLSSTGGGMRSIYEHRIELQAMNENLELLRLRNKAIFYNDLFQTISQYQTRSNVTAQEINVRRAESLIMLGPVLERLQLELLAPAIDRTFSIMSRAGILPPAPANISGAELSAQYSNLMNNDPRLIRPPDQVAKIRTQRAQQQHQAQVAQQADTAQKLAAGAQTLSQTQ